MVLFNNLVSYQLDIDCKLLILIFLLLVNRTTISTCSKWGVYKGGYSLISYRLIFKTHTTDTYDRCILKFNKLIFYNWVIPKNMIDNNKNKTDFRNEIFHNINSRRGMLIFVFIGRCGGSCDS